MAENELASPPLPPRLESRVHNASALRHKDKAVIKRPWRRAGAAIGALVLLWIIIGILPVAISSDLEHAARIGDAFGFVNALFSALALAGVIAAVIMQRDELRLQRKELRLSRRILSEQAAAQRDQHEALAAQHRLALLAARMNVLGEARRQVEAEIAVRSANVDPVDDLERQRYAIDAKIASLITEIEAES